MLPVILSRGIRPPSFLLNRHSIAKMVSGVLAIDKHIDPLPITLGSHAYVLNVSIWRLS